MIYPRSPNLHSKLIGYYTNNADAFIYGHRAQEFDNKHMLLRY